MAKEGAKEAPGQSDVWQILHDGLTPSKSATERFNFEGLTIADGVVLKQLVAARDSDVGALPVKGINQGIAEDPNFAGIRIKGIRGRLAKLKTRGLVWQEPNKGSYWLTQDAYLVISQMRFDAITAK